MSGIVLRVRSNSSDPKSKITETSLTYEWGQRQRRLLGVVRQQLVLMKLKALLIVSTVICWNLSFQLRNQGTGAVNIRVQSAVNESPSYILMEVAAALSDVH